MRKTVMAIAVALVFFSLSDVLLWQRIFEYNKLWQYDWPYQGGRGAILLGLIAIGIVLLWGKISESIYYALALYTLAYSGIADILYYVLDGRPIPAELFWLDANRLILFKPVTQTNLWASAIVWVVAWGVVAIAISTLWPKNRNLCYNLGMGHLRKIRRNQEKQQFMDITFGQLVGGSQAIAVLNSQPLRGRQAALFSRTVRVLEPELKTYNDARTAIFEKHGDWDVDHKSCAIRKDEQEEADKEFKELWETVISVNIKLLPFDLLDNVELSAEQFATVEWLFEEPKDG